MAKQRMAGYTPLRGAPQAPEQESDALAHQAPVQQGPTTATASSYRRPPRGGRQQQQQGRRGQHQSQGEQQQQFRQAGAPVQPCTDTTAEGERSC